MKNRFYHLTAAVLLLPLLLFGCGGAEDGDLTPPAFTFDGIQSPTSVPDGHSLSGTADPEATIEVEVNTAAAISNLTVSGGSWSFDVDGLVEGLNTISIDVSDPIGNSTIYFINIVLDTTGPTVTMDQFKTFTKNTTQVLAGTIAELDAKDVQVSIDGGIWNPVDDINGGIWTYSLILPDDGSVHDIAVRGIDRLDNITDVADHATAQITVDSTNAPDFTIDNIVAPGFTVPQTLPVYLPDPLNSGDISLEGTYDSVNYDLILTTNPITSPLFNTNAPLGPDTWSLDFDDLPAGNTVTTFSIQDTSQVEVAQANVLLVRDQSGPLLITTVPEHGDDSFPPSNPLELTFSETMATIENDGTFFELVADDGTTVSFSNDPATTDFRTFSFTPDSLLQPETKYTVNFIDASTAVVEDVYGNDFVRPTGLWVFTTTP